MTVAGLRHAWRSTVWCVLRPWPARGESQRGSAEYHLLPAARTPPISVAQWQIENVYIHIWSCLLDRNDQSPPLPIRYQGE